MTKSKPLSIGDRVRFSAEWLRNTGSYTGSVGQLTGTVSAIREYRAMPPIATVQWDQNYFNTQETNVLTTNLQRIKHQP